MGERCGAGGPAREAKGREEGDLMKGSESLLQGEITGEMGA